MANFPQDLRTYIIGTTAITSKVGTGAAAARVHYNKTPQASGRPQIWLRTSSDTESRTFDTIGGLHEAFIDLECIAESETDVQDLADAVKDRLDGLSTTAFANHTLQGMWITDKDDQYFPKSIDADDGRHVIAFDVHAFYST